MEITSTIAHYIVASKFEQIPQRVVEKTKQVLLDTLGCGIGGSETEPGRIVSDFAVQQGGTREATLFGRGDRINCVMAGYTNGILVDVLDYQETLLCHPSTTVIPAALALAERERCTGKDLLTAIVVGYDVCMRIGAAVKPSPAVSKVVAVVYCSLAFGAGAAAAKVLRLDEERVAHCIGYTGACTPVPTWISKWPRPLHYIKNNFGEQTRAGIMGALLAQMGFLGPRPMLDHELGFWRMIGSDRYDKRLALEGLGEEYRIMADTFKPYPSCRWNHPTLDMVTEIMKDNGLQTDQIEQITVKTFDEMAQWFADYAPTNIVDAEFSLPYAVAMVLAGVEPGPEWYRDDILKSDTIKDLTGRVILETDSLADKKFYEGGGYPTTVEIRVRDGRIVSKSADFARGDPRKPMTNDELVEKFRRLTTPIIGAVKSKRLRQLIEDLEGVTDISELASCLSP
jgi:2-methylcitrate dehydratase PrpD